MDVEPPIPSQVHNARRPGALGDYDIVMLARRPCAPPLALVSLVAGDGQWLKARSGFGVCQTTLDKSVFAHVLGRPDLLVIPGLTLAPAL